MLESYFNLVIAVVRIGISSILCTDLGRRDACIRSPDKSGVYVDEVWPVCTERIREIESWPCLNFAVERDEPMHRCGREKQKRSDEEWERGDVVPFTPSNIGIHKSTVIVIV